MKFVLLPWLVLLLVACGDSPVYVDTFEFTCAEPTPTTSPDQASAVPSTGVRILVDVSHPMAGYLPVSDATPTPFRTLLNVADDALTAPYPLTKTEGLSWATVGEGVTHATDGNSQRLALLRRDAYGMGVSNLHAALSNIRASLATGELRAAILITDLVATRKEPKGGQVGAGDAAHALREWLSSAAVDQGKAGIGILGIRVPYFGATPPDRCRTNGGLGCRYSEDLERWIQLETALPLPVYAIVLGQDTDAVRQVGERLARDVAEAHKLPKGDVQWELLTPPRSPQGTTLRCSAPDAPKVLVTAGGQVDCGARGEVGMACVWSGFPAAAVEHWTASWPGVVLSGGQSENLSLTVTCPEVKNSSGGPLRVGLDVLPTPAAPADWASWGANTDGVDTPPGRTLGLEMFLSATRTAPTQRTVECVGSPSASGTR